MHNVGEGNLGGRSRHDKTASWSGLSAWKEYVGQKLIYDGVSLAVALKSQSHENFNIVTKSKALKENV